MSAYGIDVFNFEFWDGPPPVVPTQKVIVSHRPGVSGVSHQLLGTWGATFQVNLTAHFASQLLAITAHAQMITLIGTGGKFLKYNNINWSGMYGVVFNVDDIEMVTLKSVPRLIGPTYDYTAGAILVARFILTPQKV